MSNNLNKVEDSIGYTFRNFDLLQQAFTRRSYSEENGGQNNEVLEFVGDKALDLAVISILTQRFGVMTEDKKWNELKLTNPKYFKTKTKEGVFTDIKKDLVEKKSLAKSMSALGFHKMLFMGKGDIVNHIEEQDSVKEDLFEAIVGAVAIDSKFDMEVITEVVETMIDFDAYFENKEFDDNYVGKLQEWAQSVELGMPRYTYQKNYYNGYVCEVHLDGFDNYRSSWRAQSESKAKARMLAAKNAYIYLQENGFIANPFIEAVGEPIEEEALRQINELVQKNLLSKPQYTFEERMSAQGEKYWYCEVIVDEVPEFYFSGEEYSKKDAQREAAYNLLCHIMGIENEQDESEEY